MLIILVDAAGWKNNDHIKQIFPTPTSTLIPWHRKAPTTQTVRLISTTCQNRGKEEDMSLT
jgi:hypothetical protein